MKLKPLLRTTQAKRLFSLSRWLHIYVSTALFSLLLFFCITGITLNHPKWAVSNEVRTTEIPLSQSLKDSIDKQSELPLKQIAQFVSLSTGLSKPKNIDIMLEENEITYDYSVPAGYVFVTVFIQQAVMEVEYQSPDFLGLMNDLHKGRHSGDFWRGLIDISAALMLLFTLTGLFILLQNAKHRGQALLILFIGALTPVGIYFFLVPRAIL